VKTKTYNDVRKQEYLITFRGHGALSQVQTLTSCESGVAAAAKSAAEYWCRSRRSPFVVYSVGPIADGSEISGTVSVDVTAPCTVFVTDPQSDLRVGHDFRRKGDAEEFRDKCRESRIRADIVVWLKQKKPSRVNG
jgi:hypothetical protein